MKLSFIIPAHNEENYISNCLDSITRESQGKNYCLETIVVNNASTDQTEKIVSRYPWVTIVEEPKKGLARARQAGFLASTGDLVANIDADTILPPGWIDTVLQEFSDNKKLVALSGPHIFYGVPKTVNYWGQFFYCISFITYVVNRFVLRISSVIQGGNFVVRRSALEHIGGYNATFQFYGEDADLAHRLHKIGHVKFTFKLPIYASGRRLVAEGKFTTAFRYIINYVWAVFTGRPLTTTALDIRLADGGSTAASLTKTIKL